MTIAFAVFVAISLVLELTAFRSRRHRGPTDVPGTGTDSLLGFPSDPGCSSDIGSGVGGGCDSPW